MTRRYDLTDEAYGLIEELLPPKGQRGGQWNTHRQTLTGIFWVLYTGAHWRELPERYGKRSSVHDRLTRWRKDGTLDRILERLHRKLDEQGRLDLDRWCVDATQIRASRAAAGARGENGGPRGRRGRAR
jgi:transposase